VPVAVRTAGMTALCVVCAYLCLLLCLFVGPRFFNPGLTRLTVLAHGLTLFH